MDARRSAGPPSSPGPQVPDPGPLKTREQALVFAIPAAVRDEVFAHALAEVPNEACGLLAGCDGAVERFYPMSNQDHSPITYRLDPREVVAAVGDMEVLGWNLVAIFHSHVDAEAYPSPTDRRQAMFPDAFYVLASLADRAHPGLRAFTIRNQDEVSEHPILVT